jgi:hypothetical protein
LNVIEFTNEHILVDETPLDSHFLALKAQKAAAAFIAVGRLPIRYAVTAAP